MLYQRARRARGTRGAFCSGRFQYPGNTEGPRCTAGLRRPARLPASSVSSTSGVAVTRTASRSDTASCGLRDRQSECGRTCRRWSRWARRGCSSAACGQSCDNVAQVLDRKHFARKQHEPQRPCSRARPDRRTAPAGRESTASSTRPSACGSDDERGQLLRATCPSSSEMTYSVAPCLSGT